MLESKKTQYDLTSQGFTLIETIVVVVIIAVLAAALLPRMITNNNRLLIQSTDQIKAIVLALKTEAIMTGQPHGIEILNKRSYQVVVFDQNWKPVREQAELQLPSPLEFALNQHSENQPGLGAADNNDNEDNNENNLGVVVEPSGIIAYLRLTIKSPDGHARIILDKHNQPTLVSADERE